MGEFELNDCSICGSWAKMNSTFFEKTGHKYWVECQGCHRRGELEETPESAANSWNHGTPVKRKFRKKPVVIEAYQTQKEMDIETLEGTHHASVGDWIITGVKGEQYPCKPDIFEQTYEPVEEE